MPEVVRGKRGDAGRRRDRRDRPRRLLVSRPESAILGVEISYRKTNAASVGFVYEDANDDDEEVPLLAVV